MPDLPPLDEDDEHGDKPPEDLEDLGDLVADDAAISDEDEHDALDDAESMGVDVGIALDASDAACDDDKGELVLDIQDLLNITDETSDPTADEPGFGAQDPDPAAEIDSSEHDAWIDAGDGENDEPLGDLVSDELPELDGEDGSDESSEPDEDLELPEDEPRPRPEPHAWSRTACVAAGETLSAVAVCDGQIVAAAVDILWFRENSEDATRLAARGSRITDLVLAGPESDTAVFATGMGTLGRRRRASHAAEALETWRAAAGIPGGDTVTLELGVRPTPDRSELWLRADDRLLVSSDLGTSWRRIDAPEPVSAFALLPDRIFAVSGERRSRRLVSARLSRLAWAEHRLGEDSMRILAGERPALQSNDRAVALWDAEQGVACALDGESFARIPGCNGASAVAAGSLGGRPTLWIALLDEASESSLLVMVDTESRSATTIAELGALDLDDDDAEEPRISRLAWDGDGRRLWGLTRGGLYRWEPPH